MEHESILGVSCEPMARSTLHSLSCRHSAMRANRQALLCALQGVAHRDIKLENILLDGGVRPIVKLADFGLSADVGETGHITHDGIIGSPQYFAPEVLDTTVGGKYDAKVCCMKDCCKKPVRHVCVSPSKMPGARGTMKNI
jgi:serine/threonine protein kinase